MNWLVPHHKRPLPGKRWLSIMLRSLHLVGIAGLAGAYLYDVPESQWQPYLLLAVISGLLMLAKELYVDGLWLLQLRGQLVVGKLLLLGYGLVWFDQPEAWIYILVILISGIIAHAPGKVRYYSLWYRCLLSREVWQALQDEKRG